MNARKIVPVEKRADAYGQKCPPDPKHRRGGDQKPAGDVSRQARHMLAGEISEQTQDYDQRDGRDPKIRNPFLKRRLLFRVLERFHGAYPNPNRAQDPSVS